MVLGLGGARLGLSRRVMLSLGGARGSRRVVVVLGVIFLVSSSGRVGS